MYLLRIINSMKVSFICRVWPPKGERLKVRLRAGRAQMAPLKKKEAEMAAKNYPEMAKRIVEKFGGKENIAYLNHCATRLRINPKDKSKCDLKGIEGVSGVLGLSDNGDEIQVIIGQSVEQLYPEVEKLVGAASGAPAGTPKGKKSMADVVSGFMLMISGIMTPVIPALATAGFVTVLLTLLSLAGLIQSTDTTYIILNGFAQSAFYFLPIYVAWSSARRFGTEPIIAMLLAAGLLYPDWVNLVNTLTGEGQTFTSYFGIPVYLMTYNGGVIQVILSVWVLAKLDHWLGRVIPESIRYFMKPFILIVVMSVVTLAVTGPLGGFAAGAIASGIGWLETHVPWLVVPALILFSCTIGQLVAGFHLALIPLATEAIATVGYDSTVTIWFYCFTVSSGFVSLAVAIKSHNNRCRQIAIPATLSALVGGISEPTVYGVAYKMMRPFWALTITSVVAGLVAGILGLHSYGYGSQSIPGLLLFLGNGATVDMPNFYNALIVFAVMAVLSFVTVWVIGFDDSVYDEDEDSADDAKRVAKIDVELSLPGQGAYVAQSDLSDATFANGTLGPCFGLLSTDGIVTAPVAGTVTMIAATNHAIGITTDDGAEIMVHIGIDSVKLGGKGISVRVSTGQRVSVGDELASFDAALFAAEGIDPTVVTVLLNADDYASVASEAARPLVARVG